MIAATIDAFRKRIGGLAISYNRVFDKKSPYVENVLMDLARFCRAHESTYHPDARIHAALEGRREVWLRIQEYLNLTIDEIYDLHKVREIRKESK